MNLKSVLIVCCLVGVSFSCNKTHDTPPVPRPANDSKQNISIRLSGDITFAETPLNGTRQAHNYVYAKSVLSGIMYAVDVRSDAKPFAAGLFTNPDSIVLSLPADKNYTVTVAAVKRGSGPGPWYEELSGGGRRFERPFNRYLDNTLSYNVTDSTFLQDFTYARMFGEDTVSAFSPYYPEMDTYIGKVDVYADSSQTITIPVKRVAFGIRYTATNFTGGRLVVSYSSGAMLTKYFTPQDIGGIAIYTVDDYRYADQATAWLRILATIKWEKPDGTVVTIGSKELFPPQRNYLTTVNVTLPTSSSTVNEGVNIQLTETDWSSSDIINL